MVGRIPMIDSPTDTHEMVGLEERVSQRRARGKPTGRLDKEKTHSETHQRS